MLLFTAGAAYYFLSKKEIELSGRYFFLGRCRLWSMKLEVIRVFPGSYCDVVPYKGMATVGDGKLYYINKNNVKVFEYSDIFYHHGPLYDVEKNIIWAQYAKDHFVEGKEPVLISGLIGYDLEGRLAADIRAEDILSFLTDRKVELNPYIDPVDGNSWMEDTGLEARKNLIFTNSISIVERDIDGTDYKKGDLIYNVRNPGGFVLIDGETFKIKDWFPYVTEERGEIESHHPFIDGENVIVFLNLSQSGEKEFARVASFNLRTRKLNWWWSQGNSGEIHSPTHGGVHKLAPDIYLVYTQYEKFLKVLHSKDFKSRDLLIEKDFEGQDASRFLVNVAPIPYEWLEEFNIIGYDLLLSETFTLESLMSIGRDTNDL